MTRKEKYKLLLLDSRWIDKRNKIFRRDKFQCKKCKNKNVQLQVHHKVYISGMDPWEISDKHLITLCSICHEYIHSIKKIKTIQPTKSQKEQKKKKIKLEKYKKKVRFMKVKEHIK